MSPRREWRDTWDLLEEAVRLRASDVMVREGLHVSFKIHGSWVAYSPEAVDSETVVRALNEIGKELVTDGRGSFYERLRHEKEIDFSVASPSGLRFRINAFMTAMGGGFVARVINTSPPRLEELGFKRTSIDAIYRLIQKKAGLVLVTGPTGSGKSTTLAAIIQRINETSHAHIITIEDPIEFLFTPVKSLINQREVGGHTKSFIHALRAALRQAPDVILVGEMRDTETIKAALTAAETGHLVFGTLHTRSAAETVSRIVDALPAGDKEVARQQLASSLSMIIAQKLVPNKDKSKLIMAYELMLNKTVFAQAILGSEKEGNVWAKFYDALKASTNEGMQAIEDHLAELVAAGEVEEAVGRAYANRVDIFERELQRLRASGQRPVSTEKTEDIPSPPKGSPISKLFGGK